MSKTKKGWLSPHKTCIKESDIMGGGPHGTMDSVFASRPAAPGSNPGVSEIFLRKIVDVAKVNRRLCCLEKWTAEALKYTLIEPI